MKKIVNFISEHWPALLIAIAIIGALVTFFIPLFVAIARVMWDMAINNPSALL